MDCRNVVGVALVQYAELMRIAFAPRVRGRAYARSKKALTSATCRVPFIDGRLRNIRLP